jgi:thioredoxin-like negative regulator of GroEL
VEGEEREMRVVYSRIGLLLVTLCLAVSAYGQTKPSSEQTLQAGRVALGQKHYAEAIRLLEGGLEESPNNLELKVELGRAYLYNRQDELAIQLFQQVLREQPRNRAAKLELARTFGYHRQYKSSNQMYRELLASKPDDEAAQLGLIRNLIHEKQSAEARRELEQALALHPNSQRLQEYKQRLEREEIDRTQSARRQGNREPLAAVRNQPGGVMGSGAYFSDSAGNRSRRFTQEFNREITHRLSTRLRVEERSLWKNAGPRANVLWGTGELRMRLMPSLLFSGAGGGVRFADGTSRTLYRGEVEFHPANRLWFSAGFLRRPISPTFQAAQFNLLAEGWRTGLEWYPKAWRVNAAWSREHYSDGNVGRRLDTELLRWLGEPRFAVGVGYRFRYIAFDQSFLHGYFDPSKYYSHLGVTGVKLRRGKHFRGEYLAGVGVESISGAPYQFAWDLELRNRVSLANWELGGDYFYYHLAQNAGAFRSQAARLLIGYHF